MKGDNWKIMSIIVSFCEINCIIRIHFERNSSKIDSQMMSMGQLSYQKLLNVCVYNGIAMDNKTTKTGWQLKLQSKLVLFYKKSFALTLDRL